MDQGKLYIILGKFGGFFMNIIAIICVAVFLKESAFADTVIGSLTTLLAIQGRDLYRSSTSQ